MEYNVKSNNPYESEVARMIEQFRKQPIQVMQKDDFKAAPVIDRSKWEPCPCCKPGCHNCVNMNAWDRYGKPNVCLQCNHYSNYEPDDRFCSDCGRPLTESSWEKLERKVFGE